MNMEKPFYKKAIDYWAQIPATLDGMLGGFGFISDIDVEGSKEFLDDLFASNSGLRKSRALDCGAGIGRVTKFVLLPHFEKVDIVEQDEKFVKVMKEFVGKDSMKLDNLYHIGLQNFKPQEKYDLVWSQWVLGHLDDNDLVNFLVKCKNSLAEDGVIVVKENITSSGELEMDEIDSSVTRPLNALRNIFLKSKLHIFKEVRQKKFPKGIYPVYMFALKPLQNEINQTVEKKQAIHFVDAIANTNSRKDNLIGNKEFSKP